MAGQELDIDYIYTACRTLDTLLSKGFGPNALHAILCTSTGQVMITNSGAQILQSIHLAHPVAQMMVRGVLSHHRDTGDGAKSLVCLLTAFFAALPSTIPRGGYGLGRQWRQELSASVSCFRRTALEQVLRESVCKHVQITCLGCSPGEDLQKLCYNAALTVLQGNFPLQTSKRLAVLVRDLCLRDFQDPNDLPNHLQHLQDHAEMLHTESVGFPISESRLVDGVIIQRDFLHLEPALTKRNPVRLLLLHGANMCGECSGDEDAPASSAAYIASSRPALQEALQWKQKCAQTWIAAFESLSVDLVLMGGKADGVVRGLCQQARVSLVHMVPDDNMEYLALTFQIHIVHSLRELLEPTKTESICAMAATCRPIVVEGHRYVNLTTCANTNIPHARSLIICGPSKGTCHQVSVSISNCLKNLEILLRKEVNDFLPEENSTDSFITDASANSGRAFSTLSDRVGAWVLGGPGTDPEDKLFKQGEEPIEGSKMVGETDLKVNRCSHSVRAVFTLGGGAFHMMLSAALGAYQKRCGDDKLRDVARLLQGALLAIPMRLVMNSYKPKAKQMTVFHLLKAMADSVDGVAVSIDGRTGDVSRPHPLSSNAVIEPLYANISLVYHTLNLLEQILRVDRLVPVQRLDAPPEQK